MAFGDVLYSSITLAIRCYQMIGGCWRYTVHTAWWPLYWLSCRCTGIYLVDVVILQMWLSCRYGYLVDMVILQIWLSCRCGFLVDVFFLQMWLSCKCGFLVHCFKSLQFHFCTMKSLRLFTEIKAVIGRNFLSCHMLVSFQPIDRIYFYHHIQVFFLHTFLTTEIIR